MILCRSVDGYTAGASIQITWLLGAALFHKTAAEVTILFRADS